MASSIRYDESLGIWYEGNGEIIIVSNWSHDDIQLNKDKALWLIVRLEEHFGLGNVRT